MQVYEAEVEDEIVVERVTNPQIRREPFELISNYEPKKTETTSVSMRIALKDDIPVYQSACHLAFSENQDLNKQIDEWSEQGIKFPVPTTVKEVQSFLGLTGYFRKFIPAYSQIAKPLSDLTRKDNPFMFEQPQMDAFEKLKKLLTESLVLSIFQQGKTTELHTDASQQGYGTVLLQEAEDGKLHPVQYMSQKTTPAEEKYSSYELEFLAVVNALKKFRTYLLGNHFKIITNCLAFQKTMDKKIVTRIARWELLLEEYDYEIVHRYGQRMQHVDTLSTMIISDTLTARLKRAQQEDENIQNLKSLTGTNNATECFTSNEMLYKYVDGRELIAVPRDMQTELIKLVHEKGHFSSAKTEEIVKREFFIPNLRKQVQNVIINCVSCILANKKSGKKEGFLNPIPKEDVPLSTYHVDFIGPLPSTNKRYRHILTIIDAFTKFTWLYPVKSTTLEDALDKLKLQQKTFGNPKRMITQTRVLLLTPKDLMTIAPKRKSKICRLPSAYPEGTVKWR
ncbi:transposon Tf2-11 polyprotein [Trichonephila clavipes]|uniref:RNA-directed DNA polymerase n=1 Tax=Trichonephila clavipes TaxID=2585209 RepID=A0A8X6VRQ7_TRICX|nr:transposon Tf2-11 polyprotein [Trichonephila clavipes]